MALDACMGPAKDTLKSLTSTTKAHAERKDTRGGETAKLSEKQQQQQQRTKHSRKVRERAHDQDRLEHEDVFAVRCRQDSSSTVVAAAVLPCCWAVRVLTLVGGGRWRGQRPHGMRQVAHSPTVLPQKLAGREVPGDSEAKPPPKHRTHACTHSWFHSWD